MDELLFSHRVHCPSRQLITYASPCKKATRRCMPLNLCHSPHKPPLTTHYLSGRQLCSEHLLADANGGVVICEMRTRMKCSTKFIEMRRRAHSGH
ncbi:hypothetical protein CDAR_84171 [Caerostris darwini]|uniref:Uncharacterized protein n=1 Tax=Caerostris darwini TaxID=1538125 RepID=A0AAV4U640_9ARAC|nr:hypothetical protein CDAR_84171 [Caerostris darwini]